MDCDLLRLHDLLAQHLYFFHIAVLVHTVNYHISISACECVLIEVSTLPLLISNNLFCLIIDVENGSDQIISVLEIKGPEHGSVSKTHLIDCEGLIFSEFELSLPYLPSLGITNIIIVWFILPTANTHKHEDAGCHLPHSNDGNFCIIHPICFSDFLWKFVNL